MIKEIKLNSKKRNELIDVTKEVQKIVSSSGIEEGFCIVYCPHATAAVTINENADQNVKSDVLKKLSELIPENAGYSHAEGNADSHIKSSLMGCSELVLIKNNELVLGTWQGIMFAEFDGPRNRKLLVGVF